MRVDRVEGPSAIGRVVDLTTRGGLLLLPGDAGASEADGRVEVTVDDSLRVELLSE